MNENSEIGRRQYVLLAAGAAVSAGTAGCLGFFSDDQSPPPRKSNVVEDIAVEGGTVVVEFVPPDNRWLMSRRDVDTSEQNSLDTGGGRSALDRLSPVGTASAKGRGATGRGTVSRGGGSGSTPRTGNGYLWFGGGAYAGAWYNNHDDEVRRYPISIDEVGSARLGDNQTFRDTAPGPGPVGWDRTYDTPSDGTLPVVTDLSEGWYRIGAHTVADGGDVDLGWESFDVWLQNDAGGFDIAEQWKVSPRI